MRVRSIFFRVSIACIFILLMGGIGCVTVSNRLGSQDGLDKLRQEIEAHHFTPFLPPRGGYELGSIIQINSKGQDLLVARVDTCFPSLKRPDPQPIGWLNSSYSIHSMLGVTGWIAELLKDKLNVDLVLKSSSDISVSLQFGRPRLHQFEIVCLQEAIRKMDRNTECYKAATKPGNFILVSTLDVQSVIYSFKTESGKDIGLTADLIKKLQIMPELGKKYKRESSIKIDKQLLIGYRAMEARAMPGLTHDKLEFRELTLERINEYRSVAIRSAQGIDDE